MDEHGPLCAGIDPHRGLVESWGLTYDYAGVEHFALTCVEAFAGSVAAIVTHDALEFSAPAGWTAVYERDVPEVRTDPSTSSGQAPA